MKKGNLLILALALVVALSACGAPAGRGGGGNDPTPEAASPADHVTEPPGESRPDSAPVPETEPAAGTLVAYFSATGNTQGVARHIQAVTGGDLFEIVPETPYTAADLDYNSDCRANREQNDDSARPAIAQDSVVENMADYDVIFLGYPIWWGQAPKIIYTFLESYDLDGKTIVPFCTSGSSDIGTSDDNLRPSAEGASWLDGRRFSAGASETDVKDWVDDLGLTE